MNCRGPLHPGIMRCGGCLQVTVECCMAAEAAAALRDPWHCLFRAALHGDIGKAITALDDHPSLINVWWFDSLHRTPLMAAALQGRVEVVSLLLDRGANVTLVCSSGETALMKAASWGYQKVVALLLERGADAGVRRAGGGTALMAAAARGHTGTVRVLLQAAGASVVDVADRCGCTALWYACVGGHTKAARVLLLEGGADTTIAGGQSLVGVKSTPARVAQRGGHVKCVRLLESYEREVVERPYILHKARCIHDHHITTTTAKARPSSSSSRSAAKSSPPAVFKERATRCLSLFGVTPIYPSLEVVVGPGPMEEEEAGGKGDNDLQAEEEEERAEVVSFLIHVLPTELHEELMEGLRGPPQTRSQTRGVLLQDQKKA